MKKVLTIITTFVLLITLTSCSKKITSWKNYTMDKKIDLVQILTLEEARNKVKEQNETVKYLSCEMSSIINTIHATISIKIVDKEKKVNASSVTKTYLDQDETTSEVYIKNNYRLYDLGQLGGKVKAKYPKDELTAFSVLLGYDIQDFVIKLLQDIDDDLANFKAGYDDKDCFVIEYNNQIGFKLRAIFDQNHPVYIYTEQEQNVIQFIFTYDKIKIDFPETLNVDDYTTVEWDEVYTNK